MTCPHCNKNLPENSKVCAYCGRALENSQKGEAPKTPSPDKKKFSFYALIVFAVTLVLGLGALISVFNTPVYDIPILRMVDEERADELKEAFDSDVATDIENRLEYYDDDLSLKEERAVKKVIKSLEKFCDNPSFANLSKVAKVTAKAIKTIEDEDTLSRLDLDNTGTEEINGYVGIINAVLIVIGLFWLLMAFLAFYFKKMGLAIFALIISLPYTIFLAGTAWAIFIFASLLMLSILISKIKKA